MIKLAFKFAGALAVLSLTACMPVDKKVESASGARPTAMEIAEHSAAWRKKVPHWFEMVEPFRIEGSDDNAVYYVGSKGLAVYLIQTIDGLILIDGGMPGQAEDILVSIRKLGFDPKDIKILLNSHAHMDHSGGLAEIKRQTGAKLIASAGDKPELESGFYLGFEDRPEFNSHPVKVDQVIAHEEELKLGNTVLRPFITPGHTRGCTSWVMEMKNPEVHMDFLFFCSASVAANRLFAPPQYPGIVEDYRRTFEMTRDWSPTIFLSNHPEFFGMKAKRERQLAGDRKAFINPNEFREVIAKQERAFEKALIKQSAIMEK